MTMTVEVKTHKVTSAEVVQSENGEYGVEFSFDDGSTDFAEVGPKEAADFYARVQVGEELPVGINALFLSAEKAAALRLRS
jgi:hypothetical protein